MPVEPARIHLVTVRFQETGTIHRKAALTRPTPKMITLASAQARKKTNRAAFNSTTPALGMALAGIRECVGRRDQSGDDEDEIKCDERERD
jgi:hypothetical protein